MFFYQNVHLTLTLCFVMGLKLTVQHKNTFFGSFVHCIMNNLHIKKSVNISYVFSQKSADQPAKPISTHMHNYSCPSGGSQHSQSQSYTAQHKQNPGCCRSSQAIIMWQCRWLLMFVVILQVRSQRGQGIEYFMDIC